MNQILHNKIKEKSKKGKKTKKQRFKVQFIVSVYLIYVTLFAYFLNIEIRNSKEITSKQLADNYNILRLYNNTNSYDSSLYNKDGQVFSVIGMIEIPKINIYYPIITEYNEDLLKISPCRVSGPMPNEIGNLCIAGHNYDNYRFFSKVLKLSNNDEIIIHDLSGSKISYMITDIYEVLANDLSPLENTNKSKKQVTLITCNNFNSTTRIIIKAFAQ